MNVSERLTRDISPRFEKSLWLGVRTFHPTTFNPGTFHAMDISYHRHFNPRTFHPNLKIALIYAYINMHGEQLDTIDITILKNQV